MDAGSAQDLQALAQGEAQQTPWAQLPEAHSFLSAQKAPSGLRPQELFWQTLPGTQLSSAVQATKQRAPLHKNSGEVEKPVIPSGPVLKYGKDKKGKEVLMEDPRVPALRERFGLKSPDGDTTYDKALSDTIAKFQKEHGLRQRPAHARRRSTRINGPKREKTRRHHHRQHGALALDAARPRQDLRDGQHPGLHAARRARRQARLEDQGRGRQAGNADAAAQRRR